MHCNYTVRNNLRNVFTKLIMQSLHPTLLTLCLLLLPLPAWTAPHALLIGIQDYQATDLKNLKGPLNDVALVKTLLQERFNFKAEDISILTDKQATHTGIKRAFEALAKKLRAGDFVYIHYSGHGSQMRDREREERDKRIAKDETWVSYGARGGLAGMDDYDILDDEIAVWLRAIYAKTDKVVFVSDSCHSATITRGNGLTGRALPPDDRAHPLRGGLALKSNEYRGIRVSATVDEHKLMGREAFAVETLAADGKYYGLFTWHWAQALYHVGVDDNWRDVFKRAYAKVTAVDTTFQQPQLEGEIYQTLGDFGFTSMALRQGTRQSAVALRQGTRQSAVAVSGVNGDRVEIRAGHVNGVTKGSVYRLRSSAKNNAPRATITEVGTFYSAGRSEGKLEIGDLLVEESHNWRFEPVPVFVTADFPDTRDKAILQAVRAALQNGNTMPGYTLSQDRARYHLYVLRPKRKAGGDWHYAHSSDSLPRSFPDQNPLLWVLTPQQQLLHENLQINFSDIPAGLARLAENLNKILRVKELKALENPEQGEFPLDVQVVKLDQVDFCQTKADCITTQIGCFHKAGSYSLAEITKQHWRENDIISFTLRNRSRRDWYVYIINLGPDGKISAVYPAPGTQAEAALLHAGKKRDLTDTAALQFAAGEENIRFLVTADAIDAGLLEQDRFRKLDGIKGSLSPLERLLISVGFGIRGSTKPQNAKWRIMTVLFSIHKQAVVIK